MKFQNATKQTSCHMVSQQMLMPAEIEWMWYEFLAWIQNHKIIVQNRRKCNP